MASIDWSERLLLRLPEAAVVLGLGRGTVYELVQRGELPSVHVGRAVRIPAMALKRWVEEHSTGTNGDAPLLDESAGSGNGRRSAGGRILPGSPATGDTMT